MNKKIGDEVVVPDDICLSNCVGAGVLDSPLGGVSRFGFFTKLSGGTKLANDVRPYHALWGY